MIQPSLDGLCCRDMVASIDAERYGIDRGTPCNPGSSGCGSPWHNPEAKHKWLEVGSDSLLDYQNDQGPIRLPPCVPNLSAREGASPFSRFKVVAAKATDIGGIMSGHEEKVSAWRLRYSWNSPKWLIVHQESLDLHQERLWRRLQSASSFDLIKALGAHTVFIAPGLSVYDDGSMCPIRQVMNMRLSLRVAARANAAGVTSVPVFGWNSMRESDLEFLASWCTRQGAKLHTIAVNAQTGTATDTLTNQLGRGMHWLEKSTNSSYIWVVFGGRRRIEILSRFIPRRRIVQIARTKDFQVPTISRNGDLLVQFQLV